MTSTLAEVAGEGAEEHSGPGNPPQGNGDTGDVQMDEAQELAGPNQGESDYHVSELLAEEARAASEHAEGERLAQIQEENDVHLVLGHDLWEDVGAQRGRSLREVAVLKNRFSGRPGVISPETIRTLMSVTSKFSGGSAEDFEAWSKQFERGCAMLNLDQTQYVKCAEMQLEGKASLRWHQAHLYDELTPCDLPTWQQFLHVMTPMFAEADREAKAEAKWDSLSLKKQTVQGLSAYAREVQDAYVEMGNKRPSLHSAWTKYKQGLGSTSLTHLITMTETTCKDDPVWTGNLQDRITEATKVLHQLVTDTAIAKTGGVGSSTGGQTGGGQKRSAKEVGVQSSTPAKRQAAGSGSSGKLSEAQFKELRRSHAAFTDPDERKPFSKQLMNHCRTAGLCLFCMKGKHRMFDCPELQKDPERLKRLKDAYLARKAKGKAKAD
ncbi:hypothetical protein COCOBI_02-8520 [Coccomyxa sp. Obi]|nr:hypothetical protein COCOBI_02-8520 [Coccomyxa sp. Obi]